MQAEQTGASRKAEVLAYVFAVVTLIGFGVIVRTPILNFVCGPAWVIACVTLLTPRFEKVLNRT
ncbi:MAG: hypothetical protein QOG87_1897 [Actinomycetota bacterium]|jgi:hypothetical protein